MMFQNEGTLGSYDKRLDIHVAASKSNFFFLTNEYSDPTGVRIL
jgi:hypothetical protein